MRGKVALKTKVLLVGGHHGDVRMLKQYCSGYAPCHIDDVISSYRLTGKKICDALMESPFAKGDSAVIKSRDDAVDFGQRRARR